MEIHKVVGNFIPEAVEGTQELIKADQATGSDLGLPVAQKAFGLVFGRGGVKQVGEAFAERVSDFEGWREGKQAVQNRAFIG